jgi:hypothetical protein
MQEIYGEAAVGQGDVTELTGSCQCCGNPLGQTVLGQFVSEGG